MTIDITATLIDITNTKQLAKGYVTDLCIKRMVGTREQYNLIKHYHDTLGEPRNIMDIGNQYKFTVYVNGRMASTGQIFNELKLKNVQAAIEG